MTEIQDHLTDEVLLLAADGELIPRAAEEARQHLLSCWECRARMGRLEASIAEFVHLHHAALDTNIPPPGGPRRLLAARLSVQASQSQPPHMWQGWRTGSLTGRTALVPTAILAAGLFAGAAWYLSVKLQLRRTTTEVILRRPLPDRRLTPGDARPVPLDQVCARAPETVRLTSLPLARKVFQEYGLTGVSPSNYEVDFLITPDLGGTDDIRNLWPQPYASTVWNAHVKDQLEDRLHQLVCGQELDLQTAQQDIATDWVAAYKKYFHTDRPVVEAGAS